MSGLSRCHGEPTEATQAAAEALVEGLGNLLRAQLTGGCCVLRRWCLLRFNPLSSGSRLDTVSRRTFPPKEFISCRRECCLLHLYLFMAACNKVQWSAIALPVEVAHRFYDALTHEPAAALLVQHRKGRSGNSDIRMFVKLLLHSALAAGMHI